MLMLLVLLLAFTVGCLSGLLGIGGGVIMAPALLYLPPLLGLGSFDMRTVTGLTITQGLFACLSGAARHAKSGCVSRRVVAWMGATIVASAMAGAILSRWISNETLMLVFAGLAVIAAVLMCLPKDDREEEATDPEACALNVPLAVIIALVIGLLCGMVGQGGSFILIPLMLHVLKLPTRVVIGSNLALVFLSSLAGFAGKLMTGQVRLLLVVAVVAGAIPGAQLGSALSQRTHARWLRAALAVVVGVAAVAITIDAVQLYGERT